MGVEKDAAVAVELYKKTAERGYVDAIISYAMCLEAGTGTAKNEQEAFVWYRKAADLSAKALMMVGRYADVC